MALHLSGVVFRRRWKPPQLRPWEGPFADPNERLPQAPNVAARRRPHDDDGGRVSARPRALKRRARKRCRFSAGETQSLGQIGKGSDVTA